MYIVSRLLKNKMNCLYQFVSMLSHFPREIFWNVNVGSFEESGLAKDLLLVSVVDQTDLDRFVASEIRTKSDSRNSAHRNFSRYVQFFTEHLLDLNRKEGKEKTIALKDFGKQIEKVTFLWCFNICLKDPLEKFDLGIVYSTCSTI